jgi:quercetin dioxygenase-like cupin family protein
VPDRDSIASRLRDEGVEPYAWSNAPGDHYGTHSHPYTKLLICAAGSITFHVGEPPAEVELLPGEGFVLPPGMPHSAAVGPSGCTCLEGHR